MAKSSQSLAIALHYDGTHAPTVTARGRDEIAEQIIRIAEAHGVPVNENRELVAVLATLELGDEIPEMLYLAVAEVIAFAYMLKGKFPDGFNE